MTDKKEDPKKAADAAEPGPEPDRKIDETVPGGKYIVDGRFVDAEGNDLGKAPK